MYRKYFGLNSVPFKTTPDLDMFYKHGSRQEIFEALLYTIGRGDGILKVTGEVGSGKTMLLRLLASNLTNDFDIIYINSPNLSAKDIILYICSELSLDVDASSQKFTLTNELKHKLVELYSSGRRVVMLIDEAQSMTFDALEEIRLLSNIETGQDKLLQIVLFGQPELDVALDNTKIRQLKSRISYSMYVPPLESADVQAYLNYRMRKAGYVGLDVFTLKIAKRIQKISGGLPRNINVIADKILMSMYGFDDKVAKICHLKTLPEIDESSYSKNNKSLLFKSLIIGIVTGLVVIIIYSFLFIDGSFTKKTDTPLVSKINNDATTSPLSSKEQASLVLSIQKHDSLSGLPKGSQEIDKNAQASINDGDETKINTPIIEVLKTSNNEDKSTSSANKNNYQIKNTSAIVGNQEQLERILRYHSEGIEWVDSIDNRYVIQLSTRHVRSINSTIMFYEKHNLLPLVHILIDYNDHIKRFRLKVFYKSSDSFTELSDIIEKLPYKIKSSSPYIVSVEQLAQKLQYTEKKLNEIGIINE